MIDDGQLLRQYLEERSEAAFTELVQRHVTVVYFAALRRVGGDRHLADDVAQSVFADLARKAAALKDRPVLIGWLYTSTRFAAAQAVRTEQRRRTHEQAAQTMHELDSTPEANWNQLRPVLDDAMDELNEQEREIVLLRFFEQLPLAEVGAKFAISTDAARMRVDRALEKLRGLLARRGIASTSAALAAIVATQSGLAVPPGIVARIVGRVVSPAGAATVGRLGLGKMLVGVTVAGVTIGLAIYKTEFFQRNRSATRADSSPDSGVALAPLPADELDAGAAAGSTPVPLPAAVPAQAAVPAGTFGQLPGPARDILKTLWSGQETTGRRVALRVGTLAPNFAVFSEGRDVLLAADLVAAGDLDGVHLTSQGLAFCATHGSEIDAYPAFYQPAHSYPPLYSGKFDELTGPERDILKALWTAQEQTGNLPGTRMGLRVKAEDPNYAVFSTGCGLLLAKDLVAWGNRGGVHLTNQGLLLCRAQRNEIDAYPAFYHPSPAGGNPAAGPE